LLAKAFEFARDVAVGSGRGSEQQFVLDEVERPNEADTKLRSN